MNLGATFTVELASQPFTSLGDPAINVGIGPDHQEPPEGLRILLVDDNRDTLYALARLLEKSGHQVDPATNCLAASRLAKVNTYDLLISDIDLPDGTGLDVIRELHRQKPTPGIAVSGFGSADDIDMSLNSGFTEHLIKPIDVRTLVDAIARVARKHRRHRPPEPAYLPTPVLPQCPCPSPRSRSRLSDQRRVEWLAERSRRAKTRSGATMQLDGSLPTTRCSGNLPEGVYSTMAERARRSLFRGIPRTRAVRPRLEGLEDRFLLYATTGTQWAKPKRITYSFVPDGTNIGGVPSNLQQTLNASFATADWQAQFANAAAVWQKVANINFSQVSDNGSPWGSRGTSRATPGSATSGSAAMPCRAASLRSPISPPPANGGTNAGDMFFNTSQSWQINGTTYDLMTVAVHEFGHALGMGHSSGHRTASMYPAYNATKEAVNTDDTSGIRTIYNARQNDFFDANGANDSLAAADIIYVLHRRQWAAHALGAGLHHAHHDRHQRHRLVQDHRPLFDDRDDGRPDAVHQPQPAGPRASRCTTRRSTMLGQQISYNMGDTVTVTLNKRLPGPGLRHPLPGLRRPAIRVSGPTASR